MDEPALHERALAETTWLVDAVRPDQWSLPTPCAGWDVRALVTHMAEINRQFTRQAAGEPADFTATPPELGDHPAGAYRQSAEALAAAWRMPGRLGAQHSMLGRSVPTGVVLTWQVAELLLHGWDLARATDQPVPYEHEVVAAADEFVRTNLPAERPPGSAFKPPTQPPAGASTLDRLAAFTGRRV